MEKIKEKVREKIIYIDGSPTDYTVTEDGKVYSLNYLRTGEKQELKPGFTPLKRYYTDYLVTIYKDGIAYRRSVRRLVAEAFLPNPNHLPFVTCKNKDFNDNRLSNLMWTDKAAGNSPRHTYTPEIIHCVCKDLESGKFTINEIVEKYGVHHKVISSILYEKRWFKISKNYNIQNYKKTGKIEEETIIRICELLQNGENACEIARKVNVCIATVYDIKNRKRHQDISKNYDF